MLLTIVDTPQVFVNIQSFDPIITLAALMFLLGFIGGYLLWGIFGSLGGLAGYYIFTKDKEKRRFALYSCILGCVIGMTLKFILLNR